MVCYKYPYFILASIPVVSSLLGLFSWKGLLYGFNTD